MSKAEAGKQRGGFVLGMIVGLLLGLASPVAGEIALKGRTVDLANRGFMRDFRRSMQAVFQDPYSSLDPRQSVFDIIAEPIRSLKTGLDPKQAVAEALASVGLPADAASRYPHEFSGGQRQRIGIARALYHDPDVLIMDEATSALDNLTEKAVMDAVHNLGRAKTIILIAHRLTTVRACDTIFMLEQGRLVAEGPYDDLIDTNRAFRAMAVGHSGA